MKKHHKRKRLPPELVIQNSVAKYAHRFNKSQVFEDKKTIIGVMLNTKAFKFFVVDLLHVATAYPNQSFQLKINHRPHG